MNNNAPLIAFYLPQFHPIPENDFWWGKGFTEWTNVVQAKPLFKGHFQPRLPADLGFYDLRVPEVREAQADLARTHGITAFCYWHYWFGNGRQLLERPFSEVLNSGKPEFPFCLAWANESWTGHWKGQDRRLLIEQTYPGDSDYVMHFNRVLPAFRDKRYFKINGKPLFYVYRPRNLPDPARFIKIWRELANLSGLDGIHFVAGGWYDDFGVGCDVSLAEWGFDSVNAIKPKISSTHPKILKIRNEIYKSFNCFPNRIDFLSAVNEMHDSVNTDVPNCPTILAGWDTTARHGIGSWVMTGYTPETFKIHVTNVLCLSNKPNAGPVIFVKSWNEWAEGNYLEPDIKYGTTYIQVISKALRECNPAILSEDLQIQ